MKKTISIALCLILAAACLFVSCKQPEPEVPAGDGLVHVSTFTQFVNALSSAKLTEKKTVVLDQSFGWDETTYPGGADNTGDEVFKLYDGTDVNIKVARLNEGALTVDVTGLTIDLGGNTISGIPSRAFNLCGDSFTIKNGTLAAKDGADRYTLCINYANTNITTNNDKSVTDGLKTVALDRVPASYTESDKAWKRRIVVDGINTRGIIASYSTVEIKNSVSSGDLYRGFNLIGSSGIVENCSSTTTESANAGLYVSNYGKVLVKGTNSFTSRIGLYLYHCATLTVDAGATLNIGNNGSTSANNYAYANERQSKLIVNGTIKFNTTTPLKATASFNQGSMLEIAATATVLDKKNAVVAKNGDGLSTTATGKGAVDSAWVGYDVAPSITDNRVFE